MDDRIDQASLVREFFLGFVKLHILHHAAEEPVCGVDLVEELGRHGYAISPGTLYPTLHTLERAGFLAQESRTTAGHRRKYYRATQAGRAVLREGRAKVRELTGEILTGTSKGEQDG